MMDADGSNPTQVTATVRSDWPAWSPLLPLETIIRTMPWGQIKATFKP